MALLDNPIIVGVFIFGGIVALMGLAFLCYFVNRAGPQRAAAIRRLREASREKWIRAGVGHLHPYLPTNEEVRSAVSARPLWQSPAFGGLGCAPVSTMIEAGIIDVDHICTLDTEGTPVAFCTFEELRRRYPSIPKLAGGVRRNDGQNRGPGHAQRLAINRGPQSPQSIVGGTSVRAQYDNLLAQLRGQGVTPMLQYVHA